MKRKIAYVTGTRADFGLMTAVLKAIERSENLELKLFATGMHLMPKFGNTVDEVRKEFPKTKIIPATFSSDDKLGMARFTGDYLQKLVDVLSKEEIDFMLILGDRVEMFCNALASVYLGIPSAQLHGGDRTSTVDEIARHAITKLVSLHFTSTEESAKRIEKMGEEKWRIQIVGAPSLDMILKEKLPNRKEIFRKINIDSSEKVILVIQHPVSEQIDEADKQMRETLEAVKTFNLTTVIIYPNSDPGGAKMIDVIEKNRGNPLFHIFPSLEYKDFLALEKEVAVMVGNSSSGMIESSSFKIPVVNIGIRQLGRQHGANIIDVNPKKGEIILAINKSLYDKDYLKQLSKIKNPWGDGHTSEMIVKILSENDFDDRLLHKQITY